jgi:serine protease Do
MVAGTVCLVVALVGSLMFQGAVIAETQDRAIASVMETGKAFTAVTKRVSPAVVFIKATKQSVPAGNMQGFGDLRGQIPDELFERFFGDRLPPMQGPQQPQPRVGQGSGFIISEDGYILTNNHVVGQADRLDVTLHDGRVFEAKLIGTDKHTDVAIIKIEGDDLPMLAMGDSDEIEVGEWVLAVGSPFGLSGTVTSGIVSAKGRNSMGITDYEDFIQTDAAINPGNSGGPLVNMRGEAIGINTAIVSRSGGYNGIGFAIPMNMAREICDQLMENGSVTRGFLGVIIQPLTSELATSFNLDSDKGVLIGDVNEDGPAGRAGLQRGDVVVELNGKPVEDMTTFRNRVAMIEPGKKAELEVVRDGKRQTISVKVGKLESTSMVAAKSSNAVEKQLGLSVQTLDKQLAEKLGVEGEQGVVITNVAPGSEASRQGLRPGMVIKEVNHKSVKDASQFAELVEASEDGSSLLLLVQHDEHTRFVVLKVEK